MRTKRILALALVAVLSLSLVLTGCGSSKPKVEGPQNVTINLGTEPPQMNSVLTTDNTSLTVLRHVMEGLTRLDKDNKPIPGVAKSWKSENEGLKWTFTLRQDSKWSDGTPVTAHDFEYAFKTVLNPESAAEYNYIMFCFKNGQAYAEGKATADDVGVKATDDYTLVIELERPTPYLLDLLSFGVFMPVKKDYYEKMGDTYATDFDKMLFNGPWVMTEWTHEDKLVLKKNADYWNAKEVNLEEITMLMVKDGNTALNMFLADEVDMVGLKGDQLQKVKDEGYEETMGQYGDGATAYFEFNLNDNIMKNKNIRKALTYAIDRATFVKGVLKNSSLPAMSFTTPEIKGLNKPTFKEEVGDLIKDNNSEEAKQLLQKGMEELGLSSMPKIQMITDDTDVAQRDAAAYQEYWKKNLGLDVEILSMPFKSRLERMTNKDFQVVVALWGPDYNDPMTFLDMFETGNGNNHTSYSNAEYDKLLNQIRAETDVKKRQEQLIQTEKMLMDELPIGPIFFRVRDFVTKPYLKGVVRNAFQDINLFWAYIDNSQK